MIFKSAAAIRMVELRAEGFVLKHDVEHVAQHLESDDIGLRDDCGGAWIKIHAGHLAEEIAGAELGDRIAVSEVDGGVDGNGSVARFLLALVFFARDERAGQPLEEALCAALGLDVGHGCGNGDFGFSFENVKSGGTEFAFAADDLVLAKAVLDDGAAIEFEEGSGDAVEYRDLQKIFRSEERRVGKECRSRWSPYH